MKAIQITLNFSDDMILQNIVYNLNTTVLPGDSETLVRIALLLIMALDTGSPYPTTVVDDNIMLEFNFKSRKN